MRTYGKPYSEQGCSTVYDEYTREELECFDFQVWQDYMKFRCEPEENITWENFEEWWLQEHQGIIISDV